MPNKIFIAYTLEDNAFLEHLQSHLAGLERQGIAGTWNDQMIEAGQAVDEAIEREMNDAEVIVMLLSADFIANDFCYGTLVAKAIARHQSGQALLLPVLVRHCDWPSLPFGHLRPLPTDNGRLLPISDWPNPDKAWMQVVEAIRKHLAPRSASPSTAPLETASEPPATRKTNPFWRVGAGALLLLLLVGAGFFFEKKRSPSPEIASEKAAAPASDTPVEKISPPPGPEPKTPPGDTAPGPKPHVILRPDIIRKVPQLRDKILLYEVRLQVSNAKKCIRVLANDQLVAHRLDGPETIVVRLVPGQHTLGLQHAMGSCSQSVKIAQNGQTVHLKNCVLH